MTVDFSIEEALAARWDESRVTELVSSIVVADLPQTTDWEISLHLVTDETISELNARHRGKDAPTDVLSFPLHEQGGEHFVVPPGQPLHLGDVVVSYPKAVEQAEEFGHSVEREVAYLVAHGVLHILGYDHENDADRQRMRDKEEAALQPLGFTR